MTLVVEEIEEDPHIDDERSELDNEDPDVVECKAVRFIFLVDPALSQVS